MRYQNSSNSQNRKANDLLERDDKNAGSSNSAANANQNSSAGSSSSSSASANSNPAADNSTTEKPKAKAATPKYAGLAGGLKDQLKKEARVVEKLPNDFPIDQWESLNTKQQRQALKFSGLDDQEQWVLLNANAPLRVLDEYNQEQLSNGLQALAANVASTVAKSSSPRNPASDSLRSISTPLQKAALQRKLELQREALAERERQAQGRTSVRATLDDGASNRPAANKPVARGSQSSKSGEDDGEEKNFWEKFKSALKNLANFLSPEKTPEPASSTPQVVTMVTVPPTASPKPTPTPTPSPTPSPKPTVNVDMIREVVNNCRDSENSFFLKYSQTSNDRSDCSTQVFDFYSLKGEKNPLREAEHKTCESYYLTFRNPENTIVKNGGSVFSNVKRDNVKGVPSVPENWQSATQFGDMVIWLENPKYDSAGRLILNSSKDSWHIGLCIGSGQMIDRAQWEENNPNGKEEGLFVRRLDTMKSSYKLIMMIKPSEDSKLAPDEIYQYLLDHK